jgi:toxin ParE1/3/4
MLIRWNEVAEADLDAIVEYLLERNPAAARRVQHAIREQTARLGEYPGLGRSGRSVGTRELVIAHTPYIVPYLVDHEANLVIMLRVLHGARRWPDEL